MSPKAEQLLKQALELPPDERVDIGSVLYNSVPLDESDLELDRAGGEEIKRRIDEIESGKVKCVPWEEVERDLQQVIDDAEARHSSSRS